MLLHHIVVAPILMYFKSIQSQLLSARKPKAFDVGAGAKRNSSQGVVSQACMPHVLPTGSFSPDIPTMYILTSSVQGTLVREVLMDCSTNPPLLEHTVSCL